MSRRKKSKDNSPMPATGAGLIRFYSESDSPGIRLGPVQVVFFSIGLIVIIMIANLFFKAAT
jgi:preprotein translocase subunit Sec61beta